MSSPLILKRRAPLWVHHFPDRLVLHFSTHSLTLFTPAEKELDPEHIRAEFAPAGIALPLDTKGGEKRWRGLGCLGLTKVDGEHYVVIAAKVTPITEAALLIGLDSVAQLDQVLFLHLGHPDKNPDASSHWLHPCHALHKLLTSGQSYITLDRYFDLTARLEPFEPHVPSARTALLSAPADGDFVANHAWLEPLKALRAKMTAPEQEAWDDCKVGMVMMHGFIGMRKLTFAGEECTLAVISRRAHQREGTRYAERGIDKEGYVADYAETETVLLLSDREASFVQVRGSAPLFWIERGTLGSQPLIDLPQVDVDEEQSALQKHFRRLIGKYGGAVKCLELLDPAQYPAEGHLSTALKYAFDDLFAPDSVPDDLRGQATYQAFNLNQAIHATNVPFAEMALRKAVTSEVEKGGMTVVATAGVANRPVETLERQTTLFRTNCRDCLDRTNLAQDQISLITLNQYLLSAYTPQMEDCQALERAHRKLFAQNGDALSRIVTGAPAQYSTYLKTGRLTLEGKVADGMVGLRRKWEFEFEDERRERAYRELEAEDGAFSLARG